MNRINWPSHCGKLIMLARVQQSWTANQQRAASRETIYVCQHCGLEGPFADFVDKGYASLGWLRRQGGSPD